MKESVSAGDAFGRWTACSPPRKENGRTVVDVVCSCGTERIVRVEGLLNGRSRSCGCLHKERVREAQTEHGHTTGATSPEFRSWDHMIQRCTNPNNDNYESYGGRGVTVCDRWLSFAAFLEDMGPRPSGCSLDRIDGALVYSKSTCRWATRREQANNRDVTRWVDLPSGRISLTDACEKYNIPKKTVSARWYKGLRGEDLVKPITPANKRRWK